MISEYIVNNALLPGQIENWVSIMNLEGLTMLDIDRKVLQGTVKCMMNIYRCRNRRTYVLNTTYGMKLMYMFIKTFLKETTTRKFNLTDKPYNDELTALFHPSQLEERFGGAAPKCTQFWPPYFPDSTEYANESQFQVNDDDEYRELLESRSNLVPLPGFEEERK